MARPALRPARISGGGPSGNLLGPGAADELLAVSQAAFDAAVAADGSGRSRASNRYGTTWGVPGAWAALQTLAGQ